jgi:hypothetical protein
MSTKIDRAGPEGPELQSSLLLNFLVKRFSEGLTSDSPKVPFLLQGLGLVGLATDEDLLANYKGLLASPILPPAEIFRRAVEIFHFALQRDPDNRSSQGLTDRSDEDHEPDEKLSKRIIMNALREGKIMAEQSDYRYVQVFVVLGWGGLQCDQERLSQFERILQSFADDPEELVRRGRDVLKDALFRPGTKIRLFLDRREAD